MNAGEVFSVLSAMLVLDISEMIHHYWPEPSSISVQLDGGDSRPYYEGMTSQVTFRAASNRFLLKGGD